MRSAVARGVWTKVRSRIGLATLMRRTLAVGGGGGNMTVSSPSCAFGFAFGPLSLRYWPGNACCPLHHRTGLVDDQNVHRGLFHQPIQGFVFAHHAPPAFGGIYGLVVLVRYEPQVGKPPGDGLCHRYPSGYRKRCFLRRVILPCSLPFTFPTRLLTSTQWLLRALFHKLRSPVRLSRGHTRTRQDYLFGYGAKGGETAFVV